MGSDGGVLADLDQPAWCWRGIGLAPALGWRIAVAARAVPLLVSLLVFAFCVVNYLDIRDKVDAANAVAPGGLPVASVGAGLFVVAIGAMFSAAAGWSLLRTDLPTPA